MRILRPPCEPPQGCRALREPDYGTLRGRPDGAECHADFCTGNERQPL